MSLSWGSARRAVMYGQNPRGARQMCGTRGMGTHIDLLGAPSGQGSRRGSAAKAAERRGMAPAMLT